MTRGARDAAGTPAEEPPPRFVARGSVPPLAALALALALAASPSAAGAAALAPGPAATVVEQPRPFGHVIGDVVTQRVLLQLGDGRPFEPLALPAAGRVGAWLERRAPRVEEAPDGRRWLVVDYQFVNAPQALRTVKLPAWELRPRQAGPALAVPAWTLSVAPLTPRWAPGESGLDDLLPDRPAPAVDAAPIRRQLVGWSAAAAAALLGWLAWLAWRQQRDGQRLPFARAARELSGLDDGTPAAWQALHRAFDRAAGRVVQGSTLPALFRQAPHLAPRRADIERFYAESQALFYGTGAAAPTVSPHALCRALRRLEKRQVP